MTARSAQQRGSLAVQMTVEFVVPKGHEAELREIVGSFLQQLRLPESPLRTSGLKTFFAEVHLESLALDAADIPVLAAGAGEGDRTGSGDWSASPPILPSSAQLQSKAERKEFGEMLKAANDRFASGFEKESKRIAAGVDKRIHQQSFDRKVKSVLHEKARDIISIRTALAGVGSVVGISGSATPGQGGASGANDDAAGSSTGGSGTDADGEDDAQAQGSSIPDRFGDPTSKLQATRHDFLGETEEGGAGWRQLQEQWLPISNAFRWTARSSGPEMEVLPGAALQGHPVDSTALRGSRDEMLSNSKESSSSTKSGASPRAGQTLGHRKFLPSLALLLFVFAGTLSSGRM